MTQTKTAREMLAYIEKKIFEDVDLVKASLLKGEERRAFVLEQVERLLTPKPGYVSLALWLSDQFWTADKGREPLYEDDPLLSQKGQQTLTDKERSQLDVIKEIAGLCHDLGLFFLFDLKDALGVKNVWWVSNKKLVEWLTTTKYERIAMHVAYTLKKHAIDVYIHDSYQPAQDALAEIFSMEHSELIRQPDDAKMSPRDYVHTILHEMLRIERHWQRGRRLKLEPEVVILHDEMYGFVPRQFDKGVLEAAKILFDYMDKEVYGRLKESDKNTTAAVLGRFVDKVREVRSQHFGKGWLKDYSLEFSYLIAHAEACGRGWWRGEEGVL